ncbi:methyltransferase domain-containing protein [Acidianus sulfidivorans JP7]|uniref:SAM-dependent methyltransferase n=1 Tax=Acidianus sulfidivorans JP7 TaxID=619593 RepID=A0A2U9IKQ5_9CREN|nr:class I SAM-dependent methyltransferase [Acidianus sulfidivorans]AWR96504.1 methyltransferase domain-containing protein [Acidianus sulfidivorans JP7]
MSEIFPSIFESDFYISEMVKLWDEGNKWAQWLDEVVKKYNLNKKVLDVPCGIGRVSYFLSKLGYDITGVDISEKMIKMAKNNIPNGKFYRADMRYLSEILDKEKFDLVINIFNSLGYFSDEEDLEILKSIRQVTNKIAIINMDNRDYIIYNKPEKYYTFVPPSYLVEDNTYFDPMTSRLKIKRIYKDQKGNELGKIEYSQRFYSLHEIIKMLNKTGFKILEVVSGYSWKKFEVLDPQITIIASI